MQVPRAQGVDVQVLILPEQLFKNPKGIQFVIK